MSVAERALRNTGLWGMDTPGMWEHLFLSPLEKTQKMEGHDQWHPGGPPQGWEARNAPCQRHGKPPTR